MLKKIIRLFQIIPQLGYSNIAYMIWYRLSLKIGWRKLMFPSGKPVKGCFYNGTSLVANYPDEWRRLLKLKAHDILKGKLSYFHYHSRFIGNPPQWFKDPFTGTVLAQPYKHWTDLNDFDLNTGDIKVLWEPSRFQWLTDLARAYKVFGDNRYLMTMNTWLEDWSRENPKNIGVNWKCGQEAAVRVMKLISTASILDQDLRASGQLKKMVYEHVERIHGNINYAIAQDNNHGPSEAAALYIGSAWLLAQENVDKQEYLKKIKKKGRKILIERILRLVDKDGTFAQRSVNYHRVVVDTMSWVLSSMNRYNEGRFCDKVRERLIKLGEWQMLHIADKKGNAPNLGLNDGAMFENLHCCDYRDFRPSTQLFFASLLNVKALEGNGHSPFNEPVYWYFGKDHKNLELYRKYPKRFGLLDGQFLYIRSKNVDLYMRIPGNKLRPTSEDAFHIDLWVDGSNVICDTGSYSYNAGEETFKFKSVSSHNTVQFDDSPQMPKISRFLYGAWLKASIEKPLSENNSVFNFCASYRDYQRNKHTREFKLDMNNRWLVVIDSFEKPKKRKATARWHSTQSSKLAFDVIDEGSNRIEPIKSLGESSLYYLEKHPVEKLGYTTRSNKIMTTIKF